MLQDSVHIASAWGAFGIMVAILLGFSIFFAIYYSDVRDREPFAMIVTVLALTLCLSTVALFPVDIFLVSRIMDPATGLRRPWATDEAIANMQAVPNENENRDLEWLRKMLADLGMGVLVFYAAPGLSLLPLHLLAGVKSIPAKIDETNAELAANREQQNTIVNRYHGTDREVSDRDRHAINELSREELILENRSRVVQHARDSLFNRCRWIVRPFQVSPIVLVKQITESNLTEEMCGAPCGYIPNHRNLPNPLNLLFLKLSPYFPVDYILMVMIILYLFWAATKGIISIGIRFLWINLFKIRRGATQPQGLLAATMLLMLSLAGMYYSLTMSVAPDYSMFGSQKYCNLTMTLEERDCSDYPTLIVPCHIGAPEDLCTPTVTSSFILKIILGTPILGVAFYYTQWVFLLMFLVSLLFNLIQGCRKGFGADPAEEDAEDADDIESRGLLSAIGAMSADGGRRRAGRRGLLIPVPSYGSVQSSRGLGTGPGATPMPSSAGTSAVSP
ncbi:hypothetical protein BGZ79_006053 [Entomortierella chlamydospora]|nr:hypothetical protein BGZ79_006053 [Entomortierella chlamydospora]